ncbi:NAD(P)-binding domain-containing protein [Cellulomonas fimi]|uniref:NAD(P)/FAD-dependent oxidoreductase n=1 Tax=Cellulomonas fimi TaxID=1708 RepID=A0A7Y0QI15_CELFI|nr:NAD(P)-binding domain-containing protein [Cellulomonas fimi]NMR19772.1 NAD(P)/FAD-dependent oxidoreductase [Cellulomonas fimi]
MSSPGTDVDRAVDVVVVGAGQAGLSAAYHLRRAGLAARPEGLGEHVTGGFVVLDDAPSAGGAWQHRWDSLRMQHAHGIHELPGMALPEVDPDERASVAIARYFADYERNHDLRVVRPVRVHSVRELGGPDGMLVVETDRGRWLTRGLINATGTWQKPFWPTYPGRDTFAGEQLHTRDFRSAADYLGLHVVVVGGGTSAIQLLLQIAEITTTTWVTRRPPVFQQRAFDEEWGRAAVAKVDERTRAGLPPESVVSVTGLPLTEEYQRGIDRGILVRLPMFERIVPDGVVWAPEDVPPAPEHQRADVILWATGFRAGLDHLRPLHLRGHGGGIVMDGTQVVADPRLQLVGYGPSASTVGANRAGREAVRNLRRLLRL